MLLDDSTGASRLYRDYLGTLSCATADGLPTLFAQLEEALARGQHAVGVFPYELGAALQQIAPHAVEHAAAQILLFAQCERLTAEQVDAWLAHEDLAGPAGVAQVSSSVDRAGFDAAIARIHDYISAGDTYQINYTYRLHFDSFGSPRALYRRLRQRQPGPYGALIGLPDGRVILSLSPELFVRHTGGVLLAQPMKGTACAAGDPERDAAAARTLAADPKNRAENLMIVDLLRNDLGRVARIGSVHAKQLFQVSRFGGVLQMTSTVQAELRADAGLLDVFMALFPCGSVSGAPKRRSMQLIRELEPDPRGFYTGAIGWFDPPPAGRRVGDFCFSVPIRTLILQAPDAGGLRRGEMGVGAGIVHDSLAADEFAECRLKAGFLTGLEHDFSLFETMHAAPLQGVRHLDRHLQRLQASADYFGFAFNGVAARRDVNAACLLLAGPHRLRLDLRQSGKLTLQSAPLLPLAGPLRAMISEHPMQSGALFLRHKTTKREEYDQAWRAAELRGGFDMLFFNERGKLTEGGRSNVFLKLDGSWYTPPLSAGLLPGVMRAVLLADPGWRASERCLTVDDLRAAQEVVLCNALRGALHVSLDWT